MNESLIADEPESKPESTSCEIGEEKPRKKQFNSDIEHHLRRYAIL